MKLNHILMTFAMGMGLLIPGTSQAVVIYFEPVEAIAIPNTFDGVSVDFESGNWSTSLSGVSGGDANFFFGGSVISNDGDASATSATWQPVRTGTGNTDSIQNLALGTTIDANTSFYSTGFGGSDSHMGGASGFTDGTPGYIGFSLIVNNPLDSGNPLMAYGWALVTLQNNDGIGALHAWAFDDNGDAIEVGVVPEAATATLVLLAAGFVFLRRRS